MANLIENAKQQIDALLTAACAAAAAEGLFPADAALRGTVEIPKDQRNGDYAANHAMAAAKALRMPPRRIAEILVDHLDLADSYFASAEIAGPGFINFTLSENWFAAVLAAMLVTVLAAVLVAMLAAMLAAVLVTALFALPATLVIAALLAFLALFGLALLEVLSFFALAFLEVLALFVLAPGKILAAFLVARFLVFLVGILAEADVLVAAALFFVRAPAHIVPRAVLRECGIGVNREKRRTHDCRAQHGGENTTVPFLCYFH